MPMCTGAGGRDMVEEEGGRGQGVGVRPLDFSTAYFPTSPLQI